MNAVSFPWGPAVSRLRNQLMPSPGIVAKKHCIELVVGPL
jgi:hypothetical protein